MPSLILQTATRALLPLLLLFSLFILLRGHNEPGGGFIGGLLAAGGLSLYMLAYDAPATLRLLRVDPRVLIGLGLLTAALSGCVALLAGRPFLTGLWATRPVPGLGKVSTVLLFDIGVYLVVIGTTLLIILTLATREEEP
jgi:multicomponent Na+:H+ antiporter subunit B